eukprot:6196070-Pleurochrysis_carterae.AAC.2
MTRSKNCIMRNNVGPSSVLSTIRRRQDVARSTAQHWFSRPHGVYLPGVRFSNIQTIVFPSIEFYTKRILDLVRHQPVCTIQQHLAASTASRSLVGGDKCQWQRAHDQAASICGCRDNKSTSLAAKTPFQPPGATRRLLSLSLAQSVSVPRSVCM